MKYREDGKYRKKYRIISALLCFCMLFTLPGISDVSPVAAAEQESATDTLVQTLLDRIAILPEVETYLSEEPEAGDGEAYAEWEEKLYEYAEEVLAIWKEYETLTEDQQMQIPEMELAKLTTWEELAEQLTETDRIMLADDSEHHDHAGWTALSDNNTNTSTLSDGKYYLTKDIEMGTITIEGEVTLCLNGNTLKHFGDTDCVIVVDNGKFTLCDCSGNDSGCITGGKGHLVGTAYYGGGIYVAAGAKLKMTGGTITGNESVNGSGIYIDGERENRCVFEMEGGKIVDNGYENSTGTGGGMSAHYTDITMQNAVIQGNSANRGGGMYLNNVNITMTKVSVVNNMCNDTASNNHGGGVYVYLNTAIEIYGKVIVTGNGHKNDESNIDNVYVSNARFFSITGDLEDSRIGVNAQNPPVESKPTVKIAGGDGYTITNADWQCFTSDNKAYEILKKESDTGNELYLAWPGSCDLGNLDLSAEGATLSPTFDPDETEYTSMVENSVDKVGITATLADSASGANITMKINGGAESTMTSGEEEEVPLAVGENTIEITVTSGEMSKTYTLVITREEPSRCNVTLHTNGGSGGTELTSYTEGTGATLPQDWTKQGYAFAGWYDNEGCTGTAITEIAATATGDKEYWAKWNPITYTITYELDGGTVTGNPAGYTIESNAITLKNPTKAGYTFAGWSGTDLTGNANTSVTIAKGSTGNRTYSAHWTAADYTVTLHTNGGSGGTGLTSYTYGTGATLPTDWTKQGYIFAGWYDNENCTGNAVTNISNTAAGNKEYWAKWTDNTAPVIGTLTYSYQPKNLWQWLIGREELVITVPVTEEGSGADQITYTVTPEGGTAGQKTSAITNGEAKITVPADFKGIITIVCTDKDGNTSPSVTVGAGLNATGIIIEDNAPQITSKPENAGLLQSGEYEKAPSIAVTVTDNGDNAIFDGIAISGGIASVTYQVGNGSTKTVDHDYTTNMVFSDSFTIPAGEIPAGETVITITATDHAGNSTTVTPTVKVHTHNGTLQRAVEPTCTDDGNTAYYTCTCGKWFSDSACTDEITDHTAVILSMKGHDFENSEYQFDETHHWQQCSRCAETTEKEAHIFENDSISCSKCDFEKAGEGHIHSGTKQEAVEPTCTETGKKVYYTCTCGKWFFDSACTDEIADHAEIIVPTIDHDESGQYEADETEHWKICGRCHKEIRKAAHEYDNDVDTTCNICGYERTIEHIHSVTEAVPAKPADCTDDGNTAYYICSCGKWFSDSSCTVEITDKTKVTIQKLGHDYSVLEKDGSGHWKKCIRCEETQPKEEHIYDNGDDRDCNVCGYVRTLGSDPGLVSKEVETGENAPDTQLAASAKELADMILTDAEKQQVENGTDIRFILDVKDAADTISSEDKAAVQAALDGYTQGQYLDISLLKIIGQTRTAISETTGKITIVIDVPDSLKNTDSRTARTFAVIRVHNGTAQRLDDLDDNDGTITIATDRFSTYALVYQDTGESQTAVTGVTLDKDKAVLAKAGETVQLTATVLPADAANKKVTWASSDTNVASVDENGKITAVGDGICTITVTTEDGNKTAVCQITVGTGATDIPSTPTPTPGTTDTPSTPTPAPGATEPPAAPEEDGTKAKKPTAKEKRMIELHSGLKAVQTGGKLSISWGRVSGADGYSVYVQYCGKNFTAKSLYSVKSGKVKKITVKKVNGKKLDTTKNFKVYVVAYKLVGKKKTSLAKTITVHVAGQNSKKYTNVKTVTVKQTSYTLKKGESVKVKPRAVVYDKRKKQLSTDHTAEFRYMSSNKKVATVSSAGKVKAKGKGECIIYVYARNGTKRKIKVKVK